MLKTCEIFICKSNLLFGTFFLYDVHTKLYLTGNVSIAKWDIKRKRSKKLFKELELKKKDGASSRKIQLQIVFV